MNADPIAAKPSPAKFEADVHEGYVRCVDVQDKKEFISVEVSAVGP